MLPSQPNLTSVTVRVPASTANLGPGFDCLGMALKVYNKVTVQHSERSSVTVFGEGEAFLSRNEHNLVCRAISRVYAELGRSVPTLAVACHNEIPLRRGLGSSAAAIVGGLVAANSLCGKPLSDPDLLRLGWQIEGHADNIAAALLGGCQIVVITNGELVTASVPLKQDFRTVLFIPNLEMSTKRARSILPPRINREDAVFNLSRVALLVLSLSGGLEDTLKVATEDRLHQPQRQQHMFPAMGHIFRAALGAGALGVFLSGAGSTIIALTSGDGVAIQDAMASSARMEKVEGSTRIVQPSQIGAHTV